MCAKKICPLFTAVKFGLFGFHHFREDRTGICDLLCMVIRSLPNCTRTRTHKLHLLQGYECQFIFQCTETTTWYNHHSIRYIKLLYDTPCGAFYHFFSHSSPTIRTVRKLTYFSADFHHRDLPPLFLFFFFPFVIIVCKERMN